MRLVDRRRTAPSVILIGAALCLSAFAWAASPVSPTPAPSPTPAATPKAAASLLLEGTVTGPDNRPVTNAVVIARVSAGDPLQLGVSARTDSNGRFQLQLKRAGSHGVWVEAKGLAARHLDDVQPGANLRVMLEKGGSIDGMVRDGSSGAPLSGARVEASTAGGIPVVLAPEEPDAGRVIATTDTAGRYRLEGLASGLYDVSAVSRGFGRALHGSVKVGSSKVDLFLFPGASLSGTVTGPAGKPVDGALVSVEAGTYYSGLTDTPAVKTDAQGRFELLGLKPGSYTVVAQREGLAPGITTDVLVLDGDTTTTTVALASGTTVTGRLIGASKRPVPGPVSVAELDGRAPPASLASRLRVEAGRTGRFRIDALPPGSHTLVVEAPGFAPVRVKVEVSGNAPSVDLGDMPLATGITIRGHVRDGTGQPVADAGLSASPLGGSRTARSAEGRSQTDGSYVIAGLSRTGYAVSVRAEGFASSVHRMEAGTQDADFVLEKTGTLIGTVVDDVGRPIESFQVAAEAAASPDGASSSGSILGSEGRFSLESLDEGTYVVTVSAPDRAPATLSGVKVRSGGTTDAGRITLREGGVVRGLVVTSDGTPIPGATVLVQSVSDRNHLYSEGLRDMTDAGGAFEVRGVPPGALEIEATHPTFVAAHVVGIEVDPIKKMAETRIVMGRGGRIEGWARQRDGAIASGVFAQAVTELPEEPSSAEPLMVPVGPDGRFNIDRVAPGRVSVSLLRRAPSGIPELLQSKRVDVHEGEAVEVEFTLREILVSGVVTRSGAPASNLRVLFNGGPGVASWDAGSPAPGPQRLGAVTREDGSYELLLDSPGRAYVRVTALDGSTNYVVRNVEVPDADTYVLDFDFARVPMSGIVVDAETDLPISLANVWARPTSASGNGLPARTLTGSDGRFQTEVEKGECRVTVWAEGYPAQAKVVDVGSSGVPDVRVALSRGSTLQGRVLDAQGRGVGGLNVGAISGNPRLGGSVDVATTLPDGSFRFSALLARPYGLFTGTSELGFAVRSNVAPGDEGVVLQLRPGGRVRVEVHGPDGAAVENAYADIPSVDGAPVLGYSGAVTDAQGVVEMIVPVGSVQVTADNGPQHGEVTVNVTESGTVTAEITLPPAQP